MRIQKRYLHATVGLSIGIVCVLACLYILGAIRVAFLEKLISDIIVKILATTFVLVGFVVYFVLIFKKRARKKFIVGFMIPFEALGYWWWGSWLGYAFIIGGIVLLILSFFQGFEWESKKE